MLKYKLPATRPSLYYSHFLPPVSLHPASLGVKPFSPYFPSFAGFSANMLKVYLIKKENKKQKQPLTLTSQHKVWLQLPPPRRPSPHSTETAPPRGT